MTETNDELIARVVESILDEIDLVEKAIIDAMMQSDRSAHITSGDDQKTIVDGAFDMKAVASAAIKAVDSNS
jgi:hypothetical protein